MKGGELPVMRHVTEFSPVHVLAVRTVDLSVVPLIPELRYPLSGGKRESEGTQQTAYISLP